MHEVKEKAKMLCELKDMLVCQVTPMVAAGVFCDGVPGDGVGQTIDMIKDLCEAEEKLYKACYYKTVTEAMLKTELNQDEWARVVGMLTIASAMTQDDDQNVAGYDNWRYTSGRFAPTGKGHYAGYTDPMKSGAYPDTKRMIESEKNMDGDWSKNGYPHRSMRGRYGYPIDERHSKAYNDYDDAKKYYHESKDPEAKKEMEEHAKHHLKDVVETTADIWDDAKPETKKAFKEDMMKLLKDMPMN